MSTNNPNTTLLQAKDQFGSDKTPAPLTGKSTAVTFAINDVPPPAELYINVDDALVVQAASSVTPEIITVNVRLLLPNGRLEDNQFQIRPNATRTVLRQVFSLAEGFLLSISAVANVAASRGMTFARIYLQRGASGSGQPGQVLFSDYVTTQLTSAYPGGRLLSPTEGPGVVYSFLVANPGAGLDWSQTVPVNSRWRVRSWSANFTASAAAGNRVVGVLVAGVGGGLWLAEALANVVANGIVQVSAGGIQPYISVNANILLLPLPPDLVITGSSLIPQSIGSQTFGLLAGDTWTGIHVLVEEWLDNV